MSLVLPRHVREKPNTNKRKFSKMGEIPDPVKGEKSYNENRAHEGISIATERAIVLRSRKAYSEESRGHCELKGSPYFKNVNNKGVSMANARVKKAK